MLIEIKPLDTLFFRDGKPFSKGEETWADAIFPPSPATIYGALRTAFFNENISIFEKLKKENKLNTSDDPTTNLRIKSILTKSKDGILFNLPQNVLQNKTDTKVLKISNAKYLTSQKNIEKMINDEDALFTHKQSFFDEFDFEDYLKNSSSQFNLQYEKGLFLSEPKIGIAINSTTATSDESNLYRVDMLRLKEDISIIIDFEGLEIKGEFIKLGGEGKFVFGEKISDKYEISFHKIEKNFLVYLSTPAIFKKGWIPDWIDENNLSGTIPNSNLKVKLLTASIGKPDLIGGFDMAKRKPKPMFKAVPAGSVYFFELLEGNANQLEKFHQKSISDIYPEQGFGICYIGKF